MMHYLIYRRWTPDGKSYIGCTSVSLESRAGFRGQGYEQSPRFWAAIQQWGWDNIQSEILAEADEKQEAAKLERAYIEEYQTTNEKFGYNCVQAGTAYDARLRLVRRARRLPPETKASISRKKRAYFLNPSNRAKMQGDANVARRIEVRLKIGAKVRANLATAEGKARMSRVKRGTVQMSKFDNDDWTLRQVPSDQVNSLLGEGWRLGWPRRKHVHRYVDGNLEHKFVLETEYAKYLAAGYLPGSGPEQTVRSEAHRAAVSQVHSGRRHVYRIVNDSVERAKIPAADVTTYLAEGWQLGLGPRNRNI